MAFRDDLYPCIDDIRREVLDVCTQRRYEDVLIRTVRWEGDAPGRGSKRETDLVLDPKPRVKKPSPRLIFSSPGKFEDGDYIVDKISLSYTRAQLQGGTSQQTNDEVFWLIDGVKFRLVSDPEEEYLGWLVHLRRVNRGVNQ